MKTQRTVSLILALIALITLLVLSFARPAAATLRTIEEAPGQTLSQSRHSLRDETGQTWQVVLFKRSTIDRPPVIHLRLVGFPEVADIAHPQPLEIALSNQGQLKAEDIFAKGAPGANVGEYDLSELLKQLPQARSLRLLVPARDASNIQLEIPSEVVLEWQSLLL